VNVLATGNEVDFLSRCDPYPERPRAVARVETHMSWVFLTDRHAYKLKKPVRWDSLDFSTPALRKRDCDEELRLNRRLAPDVYLAVVPLTREPGGRLALGGAGEPVDWLVQMRRLPADRMLDHMIATGVDRDDVRPAALTLARFFAGARAVESSGAAYRRRLAEGTRDDEHELCRRELALPAERVRALAAAQLAFLDTHAALFDRRVRDGRIVEGHGDLRPEHICLVEPPAIIDCLEFSAALRVLDPADELAFLALECERLGRPVVGRWFFDAYREVTTDAPAPELVAFHRRYRALRRATIAIRHLRTPGGRDAEKWRSRALAYLDLARVHAA
jgi:aminoglycoside phosphotransferase family enzyme